MRKMEEWNEYKLSELLEIPIRNGLTKPKAIRGQGVKMIGMKEIFAYDIIRNCDMELVPVTDKELASSSIIEEDLLFARQSLTLEGAGKCSIVGSVNNDTVFESHLIRVRINKKLANPYFIYYYFNSRYGKEQIKGLVQQVAAAGIRGKELINLMIKCPSLPTQQKIANILSSLDDKIEVNRRINEQLEELVQALFKSWFVDFEPFKDGEFVESELVKLGDVVKTTSGGTPSRKHMEYYGGNYGWVKSKELNGTFIVDTEETITDEAIAKSSAKLLPEKSILIAMYGATVGQYAILSKAMTCNQAVCALLPNDNYPYTYLFMYAKNKKDELINKAVGSAQQNISQILIKDLDISNDIQKIKDYHKIVSPAFEIIEKNQKEITQLTNLRDTLLPKLMSGEIDVNEVEI